MEPVTAARNALEYVLEALPGEKIAIFCDDGKRDIGNAFASGAIDLGLWTRMITLHPKADEIRKKLPDVVYQAILSDKPDICVNLLRQKMEEAPFRLDLVNVETRNKRMRLGHCPDITIDMLTEGALALTKEEHGELQKNAKLLIDQLTDAVEIEITTSEGTGLIFSVEGREFLTDTYIDWKKMNWLNLPTGEVFTVPIASTFEGLLVCDVAAQGIGKISQEIHIQVKEGKVSSLTCKDKEIEKKVKRALTYDKMASIVSEFAFGLNTKARIVPQFLETEKIANTVHIGFGHNLDFPGGTNSSINHIDFIIDKPTVTVSFADERLETLMADGEIELQSLYEEI
ncbi:MAG: aminopeptidase [Candidatus Odinarchaeota archaeon]